MKSLSLMAIVPRTLKRGALGYIRNRKTEEKNHPKPQNRKKIRPKPKTAYKTVKNRYNGDKWGIQSKLK